MEHLNKMISTTPAGHPTSRTTRTVNYAAEKTTIWAFNVLGILIGALFIATAVTETIGSTVPRIPAPANLPPPEQSPPVRSPISGIWSTHILLNVSHADRQPIIHTLTRDVANHGGRTVRSKPERATWTFTVPHSYLPRIGELIESSGDNIRDSAYLQWAQKVHQRPYDPTVTGPPDILFTVQLGLPFAHPATLLAAKWILIACGISLATMIAAGITYKLTD